MKHILIVDDNQMNLTLAKHALSADYDVTLVKSGFEALDFLAENSTDLILLDISMPEMDGKETMKRIREKKELKSIPIIFLTADSAPETEVQCLNDGADDFIAKPFVPQVMRSRVSRILELTDLRNDLEARLAEKTKQVELVTLNAIMAIANTIEAKDQYTSGHSIRVARCSVAIASHMGMSEDELRNLDFMALLHDIGKIGIPDAILNKPARLDDDEFAVIKKHPSIGFEILRNINTIPDLQSGALYHHERFDGAGYVSGLKGEEIPFNARIIAIADAYDAMTSDRAYRKALSSEEVIAELEKGRGKQFDPKILDAFLEMLRNGYTLKNN